MKSIDTINGIVPKLHSIVFDMFELDNNMELDYKAKDLGSSIRKDLKDCIQVLQDARFEVVARRKEVQEELRSESAEQIAKNERIAELKAELAELTA